MNLVVLYLLLVKATLTSFTGGTSLPIVRQDMVVDRHWITDRQLSTAVAIGRMGPGPNGGYLICIGYYANGIPGAVAGYMALVTPAFFAILLVRLLAGRTDRPRWRGAIRGLTAAAAGLMLANAIPIARDAIGSWAAAGIALLALALFLSRRMETFWVLSVSAGLSVFCTVLGVGMVYSR